MERRERQGGARCNLTGACCGRGLKRSAAAFDRFEEGGGLARPRGRSAGR